MTIFLWVGIVKMRAHPLIYWCLPFTHIITGRQRQTTNYGLHRRYRKKFYEQVPSKTSIMREVIRLAQNATH